MAKKEKRPADHVLWVNRGRSRLPRNQRWPEWVPEKRKFEGKWYTLEYVDRDKEYAEEFAQEWREGKTVTTPDESGFYVFYARVVPFNGWGMTGDTVYLVYMRPKPLSPEQRTRARKDREILSKPDFWSRAAPPSRLPKPGTGRFR